MPDNFEQATSRTTAPGSNYVNHWGIGALLAYLIAVAIFLLWEINGKWPVCDVAVKVATRPNPTPPPTPSPSPSPTTSPSPLPTTSPSPTASPSPQTVTSNNAAASPSPTSVLPPCPLPASKELLLLIILAGALGSTAHAIRSLIAYIGNRELKLSWIPMYIMLPLSGAVVALAFHLIVIGGFVSNMEGTNTWLGLIAIATLVGFFSEQATLKLKTIAEAIFTKPTENKDPLPPGAGTTPPPAGQAPKVTKIDPNHGPRSGGNLIVITGSGFAEGMKVTIGGQSAAVEKFDSTSQTITIKMPASQKAGKVDVVVTRDKQSDTLVGGYTYDDVAGA